MDRIPGGVPAIGALALGFLSLALLLAACDPVDALAIENDLDGAVTIKYSFSEHVHTIEPGDDATLAIPVDSRKDYHVTVGFDGAVHEVLIPGALYTEHPDGTGDSTYRVFVSDLIFPQR